MALEDYIPERPIYLLAWILISESVGVLGSLFTFRSITTWYADLNRPVLAPPNWLFGPVWAFLYGLMGIAAYRAWLKTDIRNRALLVFYLQLLLNFSWTLVFFGGRSIKGGLAVITLLLISIVWNIQEFYRVDKTAGYLLIPYLVWVSFAAFLNYRLYVLN